MKALGSTSRTRAASDVPARARRDLLPLSALTAPRYFDLMLLMLALLGAARAECPDLTVATAAVTDALVAARLEDAHTALSTAEASLSCGPVPTPQAIARLWLAEAALASIEGRADDAADAWAAAARLAPEQWDHRYGEDLRAKRDKAVLAAGRGQGSLQVTPLPDRHSLWIDGTQRPNPRPATEGLHVVQIANKDVVYGDLVLLGAGESMTVKATLPAPDAPSPREIGAMAGGAGSAVLGGAMLFVANTLNSNYSSSVDSYERGALSQPDALQQVQGTHRAQLGLVAGGGALIVAGGALLTVGVLRW